MKLKEFYDPFLAYLKQKGMDNKTVREYRRMLFGALSHSIQDFKVHKLKIVDIALTEEAGRMHGEYGAQRAVSVTRQLLKFIKDSGHRLPFDWRDIRLPKVPDKPVHSLTEEEIKIICDSLDINILAQLRTRALMEVMLDSGLRIGEVISLNKQDIDWEKKEAEIINNKTGEKNKIYFTDRSLFWLKKYLEKRKDDLEALFVSGRGRLLSVTARNFLMTHTRQLGLSKRIHHHLFRKTYVTELLRRGVDIKSVQVLARHKSERTTLHYYAAVDLDRCKKLHQEVMGNYRIEEKLST